MKSFLNDTEWQYLLQIIYRVNKSKTWEEYAWAIYDYISPLVPFTKGLILKLDRVEGVGILSSDPVIYQLPENRYDDDQVLNGPYNFSWLEYAYSPWSLVFRLSDVRNEEVFINSATYHKIWRPQNIFYGLESLYIENDRLAGAVSFQRPRDAGDFNEKEIFIMDTLKAHLSAKLYSLRFGEDAANCGPQKTSPKETENDSVLRMLRYDLTTQERNIAALLLSGATNDDICNKLFISCTTFRKHLHNIYKKTDVRNRNQLLKRLS